MKVVQPVKVTESGPVDPRIERSRQAVLAAAFELLGEVGYGGFSVEAVAARSGVAKSTIYRHWAGKAELVEAAIRQLKPTLAAPPPGPVGERVVTLLEALAAGAADSPWSSCLPALIDAGQRDPEARALFCRMSHSGRQPLLQVLREAVDGGELAATIDIDLLAESLVGPIFMRRLFDQAPLDPTRVRALVDQVLPVAAPPRRSGRSPSVAT